MVDKEKLHSCIDSLEEAKLLVVGDIMLDSYVSCAVKRISPEAPVPIASVIGESFFLGGAGNVAHNARALGAHVSLMGIVGNDAEGGIVKSLLTEKEIEHGGVLEVAGRVTTHKKRILSGSHQLLRIDREVTTNIDDSIRSKLEEVLVSRITECDVVVFSDYCKGLLTNELIQFVKTEAKKQGKRTFVDTKSRHLPSYRGVYLVKPNKMEAELIAGERMNDDYSNLEEISTNVAGAFDAHVVITLGADGMCLREGELFRHMPTHAQQVFDVSGAGDTALAVIATACATGASLEDAVMLANVAAGHVVSHVGTSICTKDILMHSIRHL